MKALARKLNDASYEYYVLDAPSISDAEWDALYDEFAALERQTGIILPESPTRRIGGQPLSAFAPHTHIARLWSMDKTTTEAGVREWAARAEKARVKEGLAEFSYAVEYKLDGLTVNLTYEGGELVQAATRGNGAVGEAILPQAATIRGVPLTIPYKGRMEVQGEAIIRYSAFNKYNEKAAVPLKNVRNAAAGAVRNLDPAETKRRGVSIYFYQIGFIEPPPSEPLPYRTHEEMLAFLRENRFPISPAVHSAATIDDCMEYIAELEKTRGALDFQIDGAVIKVADLAARAILGNTDKFPRWAIAFKFKAEEATTTLLDVTWELGRTGKLTPLAHLEPVDIGGVTVARATLNNGDDIKRKNVKIGADVWIRRSGDVIPEIMGRVDYENPNETEIETPDRCPACGSELVQRNMLLFCENKDCVPQIIARLTHFASRDAMDVETFSDKTAGLLFDTIGLNSPDKLYGITAADLDGLQGFKDKKAQNLLEAIERSKSRPLHAFLYALGIPNVGIKTARDLAARFGSVDALAKASVDYLIKVDEVGDIIASSIIEFFANPVNTEIIERLKAHGINPKQETTKREGAFTGETVCITGALSSYGRKEAQELVRERGGEVSDSVTKKTTLVIAGEAAGSKLEKARKLNIKVIDEETFLSMI
jgi:DNA ligase (NAD+)